MTITNLELQENYFFWIITWICNNSTSTVTDFVSCGNTFTISSNSDGNYISSWSNENCTQPTDDEIMSTFNSSDYIPYQNSYNIQLNSGTTALLTVTNTTFPLIQQNTAISPYVMIYNTDTKQIMFKEDSTNWVPIYSISTLSRDLIATDEFDLIEKPLDDFKSKEK